MITTSLCLDVGRLDTVSGRCSTMVEKIPHNQPAEELQVAGWNKTYTEINLLSELAEWDIMYVLRLG